MKTSFVSKAFAMVLAASAFTVGTASAAGPCTAAAGIYNNYGYNCSQSRSGTYLCSGDRYEWEMMSRGGKCVAQETLRGMWRDFEPYQAPEDRFQLPAGGFKFTPR